MPHTHLDYSFLDRLSDRFDAYKTMPSARTNPLEHPRKIPKIPSHSNHSMFVADKVKLTLVCPSPINQRIKILV
jgi:hypothetical protein